ncbi:hypothetical protein TL16_g04518 [Triparma laevis f. inornata]|uniref:ABC transporter domain-containing protein n=1 Tax=Triparma laevis f. inornata TaxID=1714386 RepID=A0A9W7A6T5_9STRA|nr:hypothetical protein TL16_g04518 [Triparma laevis f. inornata]
MLAAGVPLPFYFPCTKRFWCGSTKRDEDAPDADITYLHEPPGPNAVKSVEIVELTKEYGVKTAVDGLSLNFYKNQITSLLGHNGAGKTSLLSMLTGLTSVTSGEAFISGTSVKTGMKQVSYCEERSGETDTSF